ncbi:DUF502 domain-containing protein [Mycoplasmatota bacterium]|nr:DUF502 domain-containing protein [Mycoplasmatota bacterium]
MNKVKKSFITGIGALLPIGITLYIVVKLFKAVDDFLQGWIESLFGFKLVGLGFVVVVITIVLIGAFTNTYLARKISSVVNGIFNRIPIIKSIYFPLKEMVSLSNPNETNFQKVVLVEFPNKGIQSIGFITKQELKINNQDKISVFIPTTPNPTNGFLVYVNADAVEILDMTIEEGIKAVISIGSLTPNNLYLKDKINKKEEI